MSRVDIAYAKAFVADCYTNKYQGATVAVWIAGLSGLWSLFESEGMVPLGHNPWRHPLVRISGKERTPRRPAKEMEPEHVAAFFGACVTRRDRALFAVLFGGALRRNEVIHLSWTDIKMVGGKIALELWDTKTSHIQKQVLPRWAADHLMGYCSSLDGKDPFPLSPSGLHKWFRRTCWNAGLLSHGYTIHSARTTAINRLLRDGVSKDEVKKFSRHTSVAMVERYDRRIKEVLDTPSELLSYPGIP